MSFGWTHGQLKVNMRGFPAAIFVTVSKASNHGTLPYCHSGMEVPHRRFVQVPIQRPNVHSRWKGMLEDDDIAIVSKLCIVSDRVNESIGKRINFGANVAS